MIAAINGAIALLERRNFIRSRLPKRNKKVEQALIWLMLPIALSRVASELNKVKIPIPRFESKEKVSDIKAKAKRMGPAEIDMGTQEGFNIAMEELKKGDDSHQPKIKVGELGQVSYHYYRKEGESKKTAKELDELIKNKKEFQNAQQKLAQLLTILSDINVLVVIGEPRLKGAAAEWDPSLQIIRIAPRSLSQGSETALKILNHEAMHVAQSCHNGGINYRPKPLQIELSPEKIFQKQLGSDIYSGIGDQTKRLESEAYSYEYSSKAARHFLAKYCPVLPKSA